VLFNLNLQSQSPPQSPWSLFNGTLYTSPRELESLSKSHLRESSAWCIWKKKKEKKSHLRKSFAWCIRGVISQTMTLSSNPTTVSRDALHQITTDYSTLQSLASVFSHRYSHMRESFDWLSKIVTWESHSVPNQMTLSSNPTTLSPDSLHQITTDHSAQQRLEGVISQRYSHVRESFDWLSNSHLRESFGPKPNDSLKQPNDSVTWLTASNYNRP